MNNTKSQHPMASVHPDAKIGENVQIGPFTVIHADVEIGDHTIIHSNAVIMDGARIGKSCEIFPGAVISAIPQDLKYNGEQTTTIIGDHTTIREYATINKGTSALGYTKIGNHCLIMAYVHVAHDCILGDSVILVNNVTLAGHIEIEDYAILGGSTLVNQFTKIGKHAFIAGASQVLKDVPPYVKAARLPLTYIGINATGLKRRNYSTETINTLHEIYKILFHEKKLLKTSLSTINEKFEDSEEKETVINFISKSTRGLIRGSSSNSVSNEDEY